MRTILLTVVAAFMTGLAAGGFTHLSSAVAAQQGQTEIPGQPPTWVPFSADLTISYVSRPEEHGHFFRNAFGSERWDVSGDRRDYTEIINISTATYYFTKDHKQWKSQPIDIQPFNYAPVRFKMPMSGLSPYGARADLAKGGSGNLHATQGFDAYLNHLSDGLSMLMVPALNMFPLIDSRIGTYTRVYSSVSVGEPSSDLFEPPPGANVVPDQTIFSLKKKM